MIGKPSRQLMPIAFREFVTRTDSDLSGINRQARLGELTSDDLLNLIVEMSRRSHLNQQSSLLEFLAGLR
jgi:hypothetical protein